jgi:hypothetical protein
MVNAAVVQRTLMLAIHGSHPLGSLRLSHLASCGMVTFLSGETCLAFLFAKNLHFSSENAGIYTHTIKSQTKKEAKSPLDF